MQKQGCLGFISAKITSTTALEAALDIFHMHCRNLHIWYLSQVVGRGKIVGISLCVESISLHFLAKKLSKMMLLKKMIFN